MEDEKLKIRWYMDFLRWKMKGRWILSQLCFLHRSVRLILSLDPRSHFTQYGKYSHSVCFITNSYYHSCNHQIEYFISSTTPALRPYSRGRGFVPGPPVIGPILHRCLVCFEFVCLFLRPIASQDCPEPTTTNRKRMWFKGDMRKYKECDQNKWKTQSRKSKK